MPSDLTLRNDSTRSTCNNPSARRRRVAVAKSVRFATGLLYIQMKKASALTAALSGKQRTESPPEAAHTDTANKSDSFSFPCLDRIRASTGAVDDVTHELEKSSLKGQTIAGSAPTAVLLPNGSIAVSSSTLFVVSCDRVDCRTAKLNCGAVRARILCSAIQQGFLCRLTTS